MKKILITGILLLFLTLIACSSLDVVKKDAIREFDEIIQALPAEEYEESCWKLTAQDGARHKVSAM